MSRQFLPAEYSTLAKRANEAPLALTEDPLKLKQTFYMVRARFVGRAPASASHLAPDGDLYLGKCKQWCSLEKALRFRLRSAADVALHETWACLHQAGNDSVILAVVQSTALLSDDTA